MILIQKSSTTNIFYVSYIKNNHKEFVIHIQNDPDHKSTRYCTKEFLNIIKARARYSSNFIFPSIDDLTDNQIFKRMLENNLITEPEYLQLLLLK